MLAAALALALEVEVRETGEFGIDTELDVPRDRLKPRRAGRLPRLHPVEAMHFEIRSRIPLCGGLGSSAAAIVAGLMAADHMFELDADLLALATEIEGHPDNVAAALHGGFVVCREGAVARLEAPIGLEAVLVVPDAGGQHPRRAGCPARAGAARRRRLQPRPRDDADARPGQRRIGT